MYLECDSRDKRKLAPMAHLSNANNDMKKKLMSKENEVEKPRRSLTLLPLSPLIDGFSRTSLSYDKLPDQPLKLSVLKLDDSCFYIEVAKTANVAELKLAVEAVFARFPHNEQGKISWSHVWGHFCLCYDTRKLIIDAELIRDYGIQDGDQLHFMRHVSVTYDHRKNRPTRNGLVASKQKIKLRSRSRSCEDEEDQDEIKPYISSGIESRKFNHYAYQGCFAETKSSQLLREWFRKIVQRCVKKWHPGTDSLRHTVSSKRYLVK